MKGTWADCLQNKMEAGVRDKELCFFPSCVPLPPPAKKCCMTSNHNILRRIIVSLLLTRLGSWLRSGGGLAVAWGDWVDWAVVHMSHPAAVQRWHDCMAMAEGPEHKRKHARLL